MSEPRRYWVSLEDRDGDPALRERARDEFAELLPLGLGAPSQEHEGAPKSSDYSRRDFFRIMGLSSAAAAAACSRAPVNKIIPALVQPEDITPGTAVWYASTCGACSAACGILLKTRDGRPIKVEGNPQHPWSRGGACAVGQASVLSLYDAARARGPKTDGRDTTWAALDAAVIAGLRRISAGGGAIRVVAPPSMGPTGEAALARFLAAFPTARRVRHDPLGTDAIAEAHLSTHGVRAIPAFRFDRARVVVGVGADFLGTWLSPVAFTRQHAWARDAVARGTMSRHLQVEPIMSLTGSNADVRYSVAPSDVVPVLAALAARVGATGVPAAPAPRLAADRLDRVAGELLAARGASLVACGSEDLVAQSLTNAINRALGNYDGEAPPIDLAAGVALAEAESMDELLGELRAGRVAAVVLVGVNPAYDHPQGDELATLLPKVALTVATSDRPDETGRLVGHLAPDHHYLESWGDSEPTGGLLGLCQPAVAPLFDTRSALESLLTWAGQGTAYYDFLRAHWRDEVFPRAKDAPVLFESFWERSVQNGFAHVGPVPVPDPVPATGTAPASAAASVAAAVPVPAPVPAPVPVPVPAPSPGGLELVLYPSVALREGRLGNNGWLLELPDPLSKVTWGNPAAVSPQAARRLGIKDGDIVVLAAGDRRLSLPAVVQPGLHPDVVAVAVGYGRTHAGPVGNGVGVNAFALADVRGGRLALTRHGATLSPTGRSVELARTQTHPFQEGRELVHELDLARAKAGDRGPGEGAKNPSMWSGHAYQGHRWAMAIDLTACTGCSACLVSCQAENNVPIVGADEVRRRRELHWIRLDRYYTGSVDDPGVVHQPMMCQHCENAPCETVCPVLATVHSSEGLNMQVYNRCVGTRYCANNCPFKVRRFNWFDYPHDDDTARMVLNPDVVVRSRGVMEKCSFCVQRIQAGKATAHAEGRELADGDVKTACQESCPAGAITFGDLNDPESAVAKLVASGRTYRLLAELNVEPSVRYTPKIRNGTGA